MNQTCPSLSGQRHRQSAKRPPVVINTADVMSQTLKTKRRGMAHSMSMPALAPGISTAQLRRKRKRRRESLSKTFSRLSRPSGTGFFADELDTTLLLAESKPEDSKPVVDANQTMKFALGKMGTAELLKEKELFASTVPEPDLTDAVNRVFPTWLRGRGDFQQVFTRFQRPMDLNSKDFIRRALMKDPADRSEGDTLILVHWGRSQFPMMENLGLQQCIMLCKCLFYESFPDNHCVFKQGDEGDAFYMVFSGVVSVYSETKKQVLVDLAEGTGFGELALITEQPRAASVYTKVPCEMAVLRAYDYRSKLRYYQQLALEETFQYLQAIPLLEGCSKGRVKKLAAIMQLRSFKDGEAIIRQNDSANEVYIIKKWAVSLRKAANRFFRGAVVITKEISQSEVNRWPIDSEQWETRKTTTISALYVSKLKEGDCFGCEALLNLENREFSAIAYGKVHVLTLNAFDSEHLFGVRSTLRRMKESHGSLQKTLNRVENASKEHSNVQKQHRDRVMECCGPHYKFLVRERQSAVLHRKKLLARRRRGTDLENRGAEAVLQKLVQTEVGPLDASTGAGTLMKLSKSSYSEVEDKRAVMGFELPVSMHEILQHAEQLEASINKARSPSPESVMMSVGGSRATDADDGGSVSSAPSRRTSVGSRQTETEDR